MASALSAPVGFKNPTSGKLQVAIDAIISAAQSHKFPSISTDERAIVVTTIGNPHFHLVLRGGESGPNYDAGNVANTSAALKGAGLSSRVMIDCSHGNSRGDIAGNLRWWLTLQRKLPPAPRRSSRRCSRAISSRDGRASTLATVVCAMDRA
jgi:phospho-2-dehydro-3-deoxyheptonate aldolase